MVKFLTAVLLFLILSACKPIDADTQTSDLSELIGSNWIVETMDGQKPIADTLITLQISAEDFSGSAGCNRYWAKYSEGSDNGYSIGEVATHAEGCREPEGILQQESRYIDRLSSSVKYQLVEQELILLDQHGNTVLVYWRRPEYDVSPESLTGKTWRLISATGVEDAQSNKFSIRFDGGILTGNSACREYEGKYQAEGDEILITKLGMTSKYDCTEEEGIAEGQYTTLLSNVEQFNIVAEEMELYTRRGEKLIYVRADE